MTARPLAAPLAAQGAAAVMTIGAALCSLPVQAAQSACSLTETHRLPAPDGRYDLVVGTRACGPTDIALQAFLVAPGETISLETTSFAAIGKDAGLEPRWNADGNIELTLPPDSEIYELGKTVAGIAVIYR